MGAKVTIGNQAGSVVVVSETEITATTAATSAGGDPVIVSGSNGSSTGAVTFHFVTPAPGVEENAASSVTQTSATLNATVNPEGAEVSECEFEYGTTNAYGGVAPCSVSPGSGTTPVKVSASLTSLTANTTYHFRISATNAGSTTKGTDETFKTLAIPPPTVSSISPTQGPAAGGTSVTIKGSGFVAPAVVTIGTVVEVVSESEIKATTAAGTGSVEVAVTDANGNSTGGPLYTYISPPPCTIKPVAEEQPTDQTVTEPTAASFKATASTPANCEAPTVQWSKEAPGATSFSPILGASSDTYTIPTTSTSESGTEFEATFKNAAGETTSKAAKLTVNAALVKPEVITQPKDQTVTAPASVSFTAEASGNPSPTVQWEISEAGGAFKEVPGATADTYTILATNISESGDRYEAVFTNSQGKATSAIATLTVNPALVKPEVITQPKDQTVTAPASVSFTAEASGNPSPTVQWEISEAGGAFKEVPGATADTYTILATNISESGDRYEAVFTNSQGKATSAIATLTVEPAPPTVSSIEPESGSTLGGTHVTIKGTGFLMGAKVTIGNQAGSVVVVSETEITATTAATSAGGDPVIVSGSNGSSTGAVTFHFVTPAPGVEENAASSVTQTSATLNATVNPEGAEVSECEFEYGTTNAYGGVAPCSVSPGSGTTPVKVSASLTSLTANTTYHFRISATNAGSTTKGTDETFKTLPNAPTVVTEKASSVTRTTATLGAAVNPNSSEVSECKLEWGTSSSYGSTAACSTLPGSGSSPVAVSASLTSLSANTTYHFRISATNAGGTSKGTDETFKTPPNAPTVEPKAPSSLTQTSATLTGTVNLEGGEVSNCEIDYGTTTAYGSTVPCSVAAGSGSGPVAVSALVTGLAPDTVYHFRVSVSNAGGTTEGPDETFKTPPNPTPAGSGGSTSTAEAKSGVLGSTAAAPPPPQLGVNGNVAPISGTVLVRLPGTAIFVPLTSIRQIPFGTVIEATNGKVTVTTRAPNGVIQTITYSQGEFKLTQGHNGLVVATLVGGSFAGCPTAAERLHIARATAAKAKPKHVVRKLWSEGHGRYSTKGNYAAGAVLGTRWLTEDLCEGTLIRVVTDKVAVTNLVNHHHVVVKAGHSYLAKAP